MAALTLLQKHIHRRDLAGLTDRLAAVLVTGQLTGHQLSSLINYLLHAGEARDAEAFVRELAQKVPQHKDALMTIARQLEQNGVEKGRTEGIRIGEEKGRSEGMMIGEMKGRLDVARRLIGQGMSLSAVKDVTGLSDDDILDIQH